MEIPFLPFTWVPPHAGEIVTMGGLTTTVKIPSSATGGAVAIVEHTLAPGFLGAPPHRHQREDEISFVLAGELTIQIGEHVQVVPVGSYIAKPRGITHTFWNAGSATARFVEVIAPGGLETYFAARAALITPDGPPNPAALAALQEQYAISFERERVPELLQRYGLRMM